MDATFVRGERARPDWLRNHPKAWMAAVATVCFGGFMGQFDASVVALTYHEIGRDFAASLDAVQWVSLSYLVALSALLIPVGRASDRLGRKRLYLWGFALFAVASVGCALAPTLPALVGARTLQGMAAALVQANSIALIATSVPADRLRTAFGIQAAAQAVGLAIGPTLGGLIVETLGWRWVFAINIPVAAAAVIAGRFLLPRTRVVPGAAPGRIRDVFAIPNVRPGLVGALLGYLLLFGPMVLVPAVLQTHGVDALRSGLVVGALPVGFALAATFGNRLLPRAWSSQVRCRAGLAICAGALLALLAANHTQPAVAGALFALGVGLGVFTPANNAIVMSAVPQRVAALTGGLINTARGLGTAAGTAVVAATLMADGDGQLSIVALAVLALAGIATARRLT